MRRSILALFALVVAADGIAGCTSSASKPPTTPSSTSASNVVLPSGVVNARNVPTNVPNKPELRKQVSVSACGAIPGGWQATGKATNPQGQAVTYTITVFFTTNAATVIGTGATRVQVLSHGTQSWRVQAKFHAARPTLCVLRGVG